MVLALIVSIAFAAAQAPQLDPLTMIQIVGQPFSLDLREGAASTSITFRVSGLPKSSGIRLASNGTLWGTPNSNDFNAPQPLNLTVNVTAPQGSVFLPILIAILSKKPQADVVQSLFAPVGNPIPVIDVFRALQFDPQSSVIVRTTGFPKNSGLKVNQTGALSGTPTSVDLAVRQPLNITILVRNSKVNAARTYNIFLVVLPYRAPQPTLPPVPPPLLSVDTLVAVFNQSFSMDLRPLFAGTTPTLSLDGAPDGSSIRLVDGILQGKPNQQDLQAKQPLQLVITIKDQASAASAYLILILSVIPRAPTTNTTVSLFLQQGADLGSINATALLPKGNTPTSVNWVVQGLPAQSGLSFNRTLGVLRGSPNKQDLAANQPLIVTITANKAGKALVSVAAILTILPPTSSGAAATAPATPTPRAATTTAKPATAAPGVASLSANVRSLKYFAVVGSNFSGDLNVAFSSNRKLSFVVKGLPPNSGLAVNGTGFLAGTPKAVLATNKLIEANVTAATLPANDPNRQTLTIPLYLAVLARSPAANASTAYYVHQGDSVGTIDLSGAFGPKPYTLTVAGLPKGTGLSLNSNAVLSGVASAADRNAAQPLQVLVTATRANQPQITIAVFLAVLPLRS